MEMATNHRRTNNNNNIVQVHHPLKSKSKQRHHHHHHQQQQQNRHDDLTNNVMCGGANCRFYYDSSSPTFPDLTPPCDMPTPHKSLCRKLPSHHQFVDDPDTIEFCVDDEMAVTCAKYYKDSNRQQRHKTYDPQVRWSRTNIAQTMERFQPIASPSSASESSSCTSHTSQTSHNSHQDYSYAYYEPGAIMCHSNIPTPEEVAGPSTLPPPNSMRALLLKCKERSQKSPANRHAYQTRYGTHENIYEDVSDEKNSRLVSSAQSLNNDRGCTKKEFQHILNNHYRVLEELNLSVEELLMSSSPPPSDPAPLVIKRIPTVQSCVVDTLGTQLTSLELKEDHMKSPVSEFVIGEDSGFSGSSSGASYIGSLRNYKTAITRSLRRSSAPNCTGTVASNGTIYGSCRTAKYPPTGIDHMVCTGNAAAPIYNGCGSTTVKFKHEKSPDASQKSLKFALWNRRS